jgi:hypothetical protein
MVDLAELAGILRAAKEALQKNQFVIPERQKRPGIYEYKKIHELHWLAEFGVDVMELPDLISRFIDEILAQGALDVYEGTHPPTLADEPAGLGEPMYAFSFYTTEIDFDGELYLKFALKRGYFIYLSIHQSIRGYG